MAAVESYRDLDVYRAAFSLQQSIFELTKRWPRDERYSLTDQIRRSSRSIGASLAEAWHKRRYVAHFVSKLTDADAELAETGHWLRTAKACTYIGDEEAGVLLLASEAIGKQMGSMMRDADSWCNAA